jgi:hypothetical protein
MFETKVEALCEHLRLLGLNATAVKFHERLFVGGVDLLEPLEPYITFMGAVRLANRNIDLVELAQYECPDSVGEYPSSTTSYRCNYVVWAKVEGTEDKVKVKLKSTRKHPLSREIVDFWWDGNELAQALNNDTDLRDRLNSMKKVLRLGFLFPVMRLEIKPYRKQQGIKIIPKGDYVSPEAAFPSIEAFEAFDRIAHHIRSITNVSL